MSIINLVAAVDENNGLGKNNRLLCHLPADLKYFKALTLGKPIIMGRKTFESIGRPLPGRLNVVLSRQSFLFDGIEVTHSLDEALVLTKDFPEVMIIGGAELFKQSLPIADRIYLTIIHHQFDADVFFPKIDKTHWHCHKIAHQAQDEKNGYDMTFYQYDRIPSNMI